MMKQAFYIFILLILTLFTYSCDEDIPENNDTNENLNIHFGSFGGLCGFSDSLSIQTDLDMTYNFSEFCTNIEYDTKATLSAIEYDELLDLISLSQFSGMTNNSCARCVDGVDTFLHIEGDGYAHRIVYDQDNEVAEISAFIGKLNDIREGLQQN